MQQHLEGGIGLRPIFADLTLARRLERAEAQGAQDYAQAWCRRDPQARAVAQAVGGGWVIFTAPESPVNGALDFGMQAYVPDEELEAVEGFFSSRGEKARFGVCPLAHASLWEGLARRRYHLAEFENCLYRALAPSERLASPVAAIELREVGPAEEPAWVETSAGGFVAPSPVLEADRVLAATPLYMPNATCLLALVEGVPAGAGALAVQEDGTAVLFGDSTLPEYRNRGVQTALQLERLILAQRAGCDLVTAGSMPGSSSQRNMERQGFRVAYTRAVLEQGPLPDRSGVGTIPPRV